MADKPIAQLVAELDEQHEKTVKVLANYEAWLDTRPDLKKDIEWLRQHPWVGPPKK